MTKRYPTVKVARTVPEIVAMYQSRKNKKDSFERWYNKLTHLLELLEDSWNKYVKAASL